MQIKGKHNKIIFKKFKEYLIRIHKYQRKLQRHLKIKEKWIQIIGMENYKIHHMILAKKLAKHLRILK